jgi:hypothetical protein
VRREQRRDERLEPEPTLACQRVQHEHRVGHANVLEERVALLERVEDGAARVPVALHVARGERGEGVRDRRRVEAFAGDPLGDRVRLLVPAEDEERERGLGLEPLVSPLLP